jgi:hypothetical protein
MSPYYRGQEDGIYENKQKFWLHMDQVLGNGYVKGFENNAPYATGSSD